MRCEGLENIDGAIRAKPLLAALTNMSHEEIDVTADEKNLIIKAPRTNVKIRREPQADPSPIDAIQPPSKKAYGDLPPELFSRAVEQVCSVTSSSNDQEFLTVAVHLTQKWIEGSDRKQFCRYTMDLPLSRSFLVRSKSLKHLAGLDVTRVAENGDWLHFRNNTLIFSVRRHIGAYPDLTNALDMRGVKTVLPKGGVPAAKLAGAFSSENKDNDRVQVQLSEGKMVVVGTSAHGEAETTLECGYAGEPVSFWVAPKSLIRLVEDFNDCEIAPEGRLLVRGENWGYSVALAREKEDQKTKETKQAVLPMTEEFTEEDSESEDTDDEQEAI